jgi:hypothetical protein
MSVPGERSKNRDWGRRAFSPARRRSIAALAEAMFSDENETGLVPAPAVLAERVADEFDLLVGAGSGDLRRGFGLLAFIVEWLPLFLMGELSRASRLSLARRLTYLHRLEHAKIGLLATLFVAFKLPLTMIAFELAPELGLTGFDRTTISTPRLVRKLALTDEARPAAFPETIEQGRG